ncbi:protein TIFY 8 [Cornus florida]|uniref:protein TIFY 8 n=1 Tax=Cornus florida TaxID=4283 RepID=UPI00289ED2E1|nr:protein TIFY 8 [Cornus florida]
MAVSVLMMSQSQSKTNANRNTDEVKPTVFHDFMGRNCGSDSSPAAKAAGDFGGDARLSEPSQSASASASAGASSGGGGRGPITISDLGSERQVGNHFEGVPLYGPRSDLLGPEISNRLVGSKRSNSDSAFIGSSRGGFPQMGESSHLMKMLRNAGGERPRPSCDEEMFFGMHQRNPTSASLILQVPAGSRNDANVSKWERALPINVGPAVQYPPRAGQVASFGYQIPSNRSKDTNAGPSVISQAAADEGSRTGIKGSGLLSSINASGGVSERHPSGMLSSESKQKSKTHVADPESSIPPSRHGLTSASRQMTIFYGGQAHVFDDVHPNKADVIMALAGSNGGSWSTTYLPKSAVRPSPGESYIPRGENETGVASNFALPRDFHRRLLVTGSPSQGFGSGDRISMVPGGHQGIISAKDKRTSGQATEPGIEEEREVKLN